jgi:HTH-type transcriptional regulator/antitoxin HigA
MAAPDPIGAIKFRMEQQGLTRKDLEKLLGSRMRVSEVLNRRRGLSIEMIRKLHAKLRIPAEVLIAPIGKRRRLAA